METLDALSNKGIGYIKVNNSTSKEQKTLIVLGVARGGTSLLAGSLATMGVYSGAANKPVYEDLDLAHAFENHKYIYTKAKRIIKKYNDEHHIWAFKRPASIDYIEQLIKYTRNPVLLIIFKDIFSIANRNKISMKLGLVPGLNKALKDYADLVNIIDKRYCDMHLFSYEKVMLNKELLTKELCKIASVELTEEIMNSVSDFIEPDSQEYLQKTRINRVIGRMDHLSATKATGWVAITNAAKPITVQLYSNNEKIAETIADLMRTDVKQAGSHATGNCGYLFEIENENQLKNGDEIYLLLKDGTKEEVPNSRRIFQV